MFLEYVPSMDCLILYYDYESEDIKIISHCKLDEAFNNFPTQFVSLGLQQSLCENHNQRLPSNSNKIGSSDLDILSILLLKKKLFLILPSIPIGIANLV